MSLAPVLAGGPLLACVKICVQMFQMFPMEWFHLDQAILVLGDKSFVSLVSPWSVPVRSPVQPPMDNGHFQEDATKFVARLLLTFPMDLFHRGPIHQVQVDKFPVDLATLYKVPTQSLALPMGNGPQLEIALKVCLRLFFLFFFFKTSTLKNKDE